MSTHPTHRPTSPLPASASPSRARPFRLFDFDLSGVVLDDADVCTDLPALRQSGSALHPLSARLPAPASAPRRAQRFGFLFTIDLDGIVLDAGEISNDLAEAFERGPIASAPVASASIEVGPERRGDAVRGVDSDRLTRPTSTSPLSNTVALPSGHLKRLS